MANRQPELIKWNTTEIEAALAAMYKPPEYAFLQQVASGTGGYRTRTADAIAMSLWPSRGLFVVGFEVKASRGDWLKELRNPRKADTIAQFCDYWYIVAGARDIVSDGELPPTWGLLVPRGKKLVIAKAAPKMKAKPLSRAFLAAIMRNTHLHVTDRSQIDAEVRRHGEAEYARGQAVAEKRAEANSLNRQEMHQRLLASVKAFEEKSGLRIDQWNGEKMADAINFVMSGGVASVKRDLYELKRRAENIVRSCEANIEAAPQEGTIGELLDSLARELSTITSEMHTNKIEGVWNTYWALHALLTQREDHHVKSNEGMARRATTETTDGTPDSHTRL